MSSGASRIELVQGDITTFAVDAIVNAANGTLLGGGGVDGAIHAAAGPRLLEACIKLGGCATGSAKITPGFDLPAKYVIHAVGPVYGGGGSETAILLAGCYRTALELAIQHGCKTIAFPAISCGVYGYPMGEAAEVALTTVAQFIDAEPQIERAIFVLFGAKALAIWRGVYDRLFAGKGQT